MGHKAEVEVAEDALCWWRLVRAWVRRRVRPPTQSRRMEHAESRDRRDQRVEQLHAELQDSLRGLVSSEDWQQALAVAARFHDYSFANTQLIWSQAMARGFEPSRVAGYQAWQKLGRQVRKGEKGIQILAPLTRIVEADDGDEERRVVGFKTVHVFDHSQTEGEPLPQVHPVLVTGGLPHQWDMLTRMITDTGFALSIEESPALGSANGLTDWVGRRVVVKASLPGAQRFKTGVHELAHVRLHEPTSDGRPSCRGIVEVEAESVAYMVCAFLGMDTSGYSLPYVATWSDGDPVKVAATADRVIRCARGVIDELESERSLQPQPTVRIETSELSKSGNEPGKTDSPSQPEDPKDERAALNQAVSFYQEQLGRDPAPQSFLDERGMTVDSARIWQLGYAPSEWHRLNTALQTQGFSEETLKKAGLIGRADNGLVFDRMRGRIIFPIHDPDGRVCGLAGRLVTGDGPKYLNTPETHLYKKSELVYGLHLADDRIQNTGQAVIVEGYTDAIAAHQMGITNTVASAGTALTSQQVRVLSTRTDQLILVFDGDEAGLAAAERASESAGQDAKIAFYVAQLPPGQDPASLVADGQSHQLRDAIANAAPIVNFLIDRHTEGFEPSPDRVARLLHQIGPLIMRVPDESTRLAATAHLAQQLGRNPADVERTLSALDANQYHKRQRGWEMSRQ